MKTLIAILFLCPAGCLQAQVANAAARATSHLLVPAAEEAAEAAGRRWLKTAVVSAGEPAERKLLEGGLRSFSDGMKPEVFARIEALAPGMPGAVIEKFTREEGVRLLRLPAREMQRVLEISAHATDRAVPGALLEGAERGGMLFLEKITPGRILAGGISAAAVIAAYKAADKIPATPETVRAGADMFRSLFLPVTCAAAVVILARGAAGIWRRQAGGAVPGQSHGSGANHP